MKHQSVSPSHESHSAQPSPASLSALRLFIPFIRPYRLRLCFALFILVAVSVALLLLGQGLAFIVDKGLGDGGNPALLDRAVLIMAGLALFLGVGSFLRMAIVNDISERVMTDVRAALFRHVTLLPVSWFETARIGDILARINADTAIIQTVMASSLVMAVRNVILLLGGLVLVVLSSVKMSLVVAVVVPVVVVPLLFLARRLRRASRLAQDRLGDVSAEAEEALGNIRTVFAFAQEKATQGRFETALTAALNAGLSRVKLRAILSGFVISMVILAVTIILWIGGRDLIAGEMSAGDLSAFIFYSFLVATSTGTLSELGGELQRAAGAAERISQLLSERVDAEPQTTHPDLNTDNGLSVCFDSVDFQYPHGQKQPLHDQIVPVMPDEISPPQTLSQISFSAQTREKIAIVGQSGAGKSTLFHLLLGFYRPTEGVIKVGGVDITQLSKSQLRQHIGLVPQDATMFSATIAENIAFGRPDASFEDIVDAARKAAADEFISALPDGYDTPVGERGIRLSGGQRQRIAIARALLVNPHILLLDEATSALDSTYEAQIQQALDEVMSSRTSLVIAHRLSTIQDADRIILLDKGCIIATGTHEELLQNSAEYRQLASRQIGIEDTAQGEK